MKVGQMFTLHKGVASISFEDATRLRAVCPDDGEIIFYRVSGWMCNKCGRTFTPGRGESISNYYNREEDRGRYTVEEWVARWFEVDTEQVSIEWS